MKQFKEYGLNISEKEYRDLDLLSSSFLTTLDREGPSSIGTEPKISEAMLFGTLVDKMVDGSFDVNEYHIASNLDIGDKLKLTVDLLFAFAIDKPGMSDKISDYKSQLTKVLNSTEVDYYIKKETEWRVDKIINDASAINYFAELVKGFGKPTLSSSLLNEATYTSNTIKSHEFTANLFNNVEGLEGVYQFQYIFEKFGHKFKVMLDRVIIDHNKKVIRPYDLKTGSGTSLGFESSFYHWRYDIQGAMYSMALMDLRDKYYPEYVIDVFKFVYIGRGENKPLIWCMSVDSLNGAVNGYTKFGREIKGIKQILKDYEWYLKNNFMVDYPEEVYLNNGELLIPDREIVYNK